MATLTVRTRVALLLVIAICASALAYAFWPAAMPEPSGGSMSFIDTPAEREQLHQMIREGRVQFRKPEELQSVLTDEQKALLKRRTKAR